MTLVDVPVELGEDFLVFHRDRSRDAAGFVAVLVHRDIDDLLVDSGVDPGEFRRVVEQVGGFVLLVRAEEEERVLDDRTADVEPVALFLELLGGDGSAFD